MAENLTNAELISQIAKNNPVWSEEKSRELLRLNRKFTYYRNVNNLMQTIYRQNKIHTLNSDDYAVEISNKFKILQPGSCVAFGSAFKLPMTLKLDLPNPAPLSQNIDISTSWY